MSLDRRAVAPVGDRHVGKPHGAQALGQLRRPLRLAVYQPHLPRRPRQGSQSPQQLAMVVSGTPLAPDARGSATLTKTASGWRIELAASGLPRLAGGRYYEAWLKSRAGVLVPVGTFNDARKVTLWAGVPPPEYPSFTVTRQRAGASPASSGERVLTGAVRLPR